MRQQPLTGILCVSFEPGTCRAQTETVSPGIHILHHALTPNPGQVSRQQNLQIAHSAFLIVVTTGIGMQAVAPVRRHTHVVAGFMQHGMDWRISTCQQSVGDQTGFRVTPEAAGYCRIIPDLLADQSVICQQAGDCLQADLPQAQNLC